MIRIRYEAVRKVYKKKNGEKIYSKTTNIIYAFMNIINYVT